MPSGATRAQRVERRAARCARSTPGRRRRETRRPRRRRWRCTCRGAAARCRATWRSSMIGIRSFSPPTVTSTWWPSSHVIRDATCSPPRRARPVGAAHAEQRRELLVGHRVVVVGERGEVDVVGAQRRAQIAARHGSFGRAVARRGAWPSHASCEYGEWRWTMPRAGTTGRAARPSRSPAAASCPMRGAAVRSESPQAAERHPNDDPGPHRRESISGRASAEP